ncbi:hypothetical protein HPB47_013625 [Ixodes persulcatus]|uniref:Uncharacterized protein n=1 Tax=Ixodes persulcatus TaxID=34615 RepID=A0AC60QZ17_IXOPE|nr:hypothetical protein HPB47_013625 [Ixodes persulcatus]
MDQSVTHICQSADAHKVTAKHFERKPRLQIKAGTARRPREVYEAIHSELVPHFAHLPRSDRLQIEDHVLSYRQLYTIHGFVHGKAVPLVTALLPSKTATTYQKCFEVERGALTSRFGSTGAQQIVHIDFEAAAIASCQQVSPGVTTKGCLFHFVQCLTRKIGESGLQSRYRDPASPELKEWVRKVVGLSILPPDLVLPHWNSHLKHSRPDTGDARMDNSIQDFVLYLEREWLYSSSQVQLWNYYHDGNNLRTTNHAEGWQSSLKLKFKSHPAGGTCVSRCLESGVFTDPEPHRGRLHLSGIHPAYSRSCEQFKTKKKEILALKVKENITYQDAKRCLSAFQRGSFAEAVTSGGPAPSKVSVATQVSLGNPGKPLQSSTSRLKLSLPGHSLSAAKAAEAPSRSKDSGAAEAMEVTPLPTPRRSSSEESERAPRSSSQKMTSSPNKPSAPGGSTPADFQGPNGQAMPARGSRSSSDEERHSRPNSLKRASSFKGQHRAAPSEKEGVGQHHTQYLPCLFRGGGGGGGGEGRSFFHPVLRTYPNFQEKSRLRSSHCGTAATAAARNSSPGAVAGAAAAISKDTAPAKDRGSRPSALRVLHMQQFFERLEQVEEAKARRRAEREEKKEERREERKRANAERHKERQEWHAEKKRLLSQALNITNR